MSKMNSYLGAFALLSGAAAIMPSAQAAEIKGPSSSQTPYIVAVDPKVSLTSILTVGDAVGTKPDGSPYQMVGIPDGLGAFDNGDGTFTLLMNHELGPNAGVVRAHGAKGAFVSRYVIRKDNLQVVSGGDLIQGAALWNAATSGYNALAQGVVFNRFCSADLPALSAFFAGGVGYNGRLFMNGEEAGVEGRAFAHALDGTSYELPRLGKF